MSSYILREIKKTQNLIFRLLEAESKADPENILTFSDRQICGYLLHNKDKHVFQKDIEKEFSLRRSSASAQLAKMEEKGLIERTTDDVDKRLKEITLTKKAKDTLASSFKQVDNLESLITEDLSEKEIDSFLKTLKKIQERVIKESEK